MTAPMDSSPQQNGRRKTILLAAAKVLVSLAAFWLVLRAINLNALLRQFSDADPIWLILGLVTLMVHFALLVWRWNYVLVRIYGLRLGARRLAVVLGVSEALGTALPSFVGTDIVRTLALAGAAPLGTVAKAVMVDRVIGLLALLVMIALSVPLVALTIGQGPVLALAAATGIGGLLCYCVGLKLAPHLARIPAIGGGLSKLASDLRRVSTDIRAMVVLVGCGLLVHLTSVLMLWCAARMLNGTIEFLPVLMIAPTAMVISSVPISLGGWGVREGALVAGFALIDANTENILAASICFGLSGIGSGLIAVVIAPMLPAPRRMTTP
ncbi:lysylphosphatidylglycerol synthase transmembrane domain-containing protein [Dongia sedimenti]|uniref:Lysylphosphatidylglycerol synthase transmembrane domain-containing protein n=1 Tax=Dongia sedimenti TaxID=3064282 RepID=A0ABU0YGU5_9PROT|nr:lysylphosphatidylglycerol synthase transmembrane domain-containing protein [Rhodospirillaceae bacterium R-7]